MSNRDCRPRALAVALSLALLVGASSASAASAVVTLTHGGQCLDNLGATSEIGRTYGMWPCGSNSANQQYRVTVNPNGSFTFQNSLSGLCMDVLGYSSSSGAAIGQWTCNGLPNQNFKAVARGPGNYALVAEHSNLCLEVQSSGAVQQHPCTTSGNQLFQINAWSGSLPSLTSGANAVVTVTHVASNLCVDNLGATKNPGNVFGIWNCDNNSVNQQYQVTINVDGSLTLKNVLSGLCLDVSDASPSSGASILQWTCSGGTNQRFLPVATSAGQYTLVASHSALCIDVIGSATTAGTRLQQYTCNGTNAQNFAFRLTSGALTLSGTPVSGGTSLPGEQARMADAFVDSIGVNTHLGWGGTLYYDGFWTHIVPAIKNLGIRHVRDSGYPQPNWQTAHFIDLINEVKNATGTTLKFTLLVDPSSCNPISVSPTTVLSWLPPDNIGAFEGLNENDNLYVGHACPQSSTGSNTWYAQDRLYQQALYNGVVGHPTLRAVPVIGPSLVHGSTSASAVGDLTPSMTHANFHPYPGNGQPTNATSNMGQLTAMNGNRPYIATETGYHNLPQTTSGFRGVSEMASGKYIPRLLANYFNAGVARTFLYELIDNPNNTDIEAHFGLARSDGTEKPAFTALKNMLKVLQDPGAAFTPGTLRYTLSGGPATLSHTLLQKRNGSFQLLLWNEVSSYNPSTNTDVTNPATYTVTVTLSSPASQVQLFDPSVSATATRTQTAVSSFTVPVSDKIVIVQLTP